MSIVLGPYLIVFFLFNFFSIDFRKFNNSNGSLLVSASTAQLRNQSALKGFEAVSLLREFASKYPKESGIAGMSEKSALFLNATFYEISVNAQADSNIINDFCPANETLDLYKNEFKKETGLNKDYIDQLTYEQAVPIWKKNNGII